MPRTKKIRKLMEEFPELRKKGLLIPEIAEKFGTHKSFVYKLLDDIAKQHNMRKEDLLEFPQKSHEGPRESKIKVLSNNIKNNERKNIKINFDNLEKEIKSCLELIEKTTNGGKTNGNNI